MTTLLRATATVAAATLIIGACKPKDAQTEGQVTTRTGAGEVASSISGDSADKRGEALVRVVNAAATPQGLIVRSDETHTLPTVDYKKVTAYQPIDKNWATFQVNSMPGGSFAALETNRELLTDGYRYSMVIMRNKDGSGIESRILRDEISSDLSTSHLRVVHAAQGVGEVNVIAKGGEKLFDGVNFTSEAGFKSVTPWAGTLEFRTQDDNRLLLTLPNVKLEAGKSYTIVLTRNEKGKVDSFWFEDTQA